MDQVMDAIIAQLNDIKDKPYDEGGFLNEIDLVDDVWFDDPRILPSSQYPFMFVAPINTIKAGETTAYIERDLTIRIGVLIDPREYWDETEYVETSASREMIRTVEAIRRHFERTSLRMPSSLSENTMGVEVGTTDYTQQLRGDLYGRSASLPLIVKKRYPRLP